jgi:tetratricopeptide (TPR) repeat protein
MTLVALTLWSVLQPPVEERTREAIVLLDAGRIEEARTILESVVREAPRYGPARLLLGQIAVGRAEWDVALEELQIAVEAKPQRLFLAFYLLGRAREVTGDAAGARHAFERALDLAPKFLPPRIALAQLAESEGDLWLALEQYRKGIEIDSGRADLLAALAHTARRMGATKLARCAVEEALAREPENGALHYLRAVTETGDAALDACRRAIELGFENAAVYVTLGNLLHERLDVSDAIAAFEKALEIDPAAAESLASFALTSLTTSEYSRLRDLLERHVAAHPDDVNTLYAIGAMYLADGELEKARIRFEHLKTLVPDASQVHYNLAMLYAREGRPEEAARERMLFQERRREEDLEWNRQNELHRARVAMKDALAAGDPHQAARLGRTLVDSGRAETQDFIDLAESLERSGRLEEAERTLAAVLAVDPYHGPSLEASLGLAEAAGDVAASRRLRERLALLSLPCVPESARAH